MALNKLRYTFSQDSTESGDGCERSFFVRHTLDRGINESGVLHFSIPADPDCFTDTSETYLCIELRVLKEDGSKLDAHDDVFMVPGSLQSLFKTCVVSLNGAALRPNDAYSLVGTLVSYLGSSKLSRADMWNALSGWETPMLPTSVLSPAVPSFLFRQSHKRVAGSRLVTFYGRVTSDFLMSASQYLPPGMKLDVALTRGSDAFALASPSGGSYKIQLESASLFVKRVQLTNSVRTACLDKLRSSGGFFHYTRLSTSLQQIPSASVVFRWNNIYNNGSVPHSLYVGLVRQSAYYGDISSLSNYFETSGLRSLRLLHNGRDVLATPYTSNYVYTTRPDEAVEHVLEDEPSSSAEPGGPQSVLDLEASQALGPYMGLCQMLGNISNPLSTVSLSYSEFLQGCTIYCFQLNTCGGRLVASGALDIEVTISYSRYFVLMLVLLKMEFAVPTQDPLMCLCFGEFAQSLPFDQFLNLA